MGNGRTEYNHRGFILTLAPLRGQFVGEVRDEGRQIFRCNGRTLDLVLQQLIDHIDKRPALSLKYSPVVETYRSVDLHCELIGEGFVAVAELRGSIIFEIASDQDKFRLLEELKRNIDLNPEIINLAVVDNHKKMLQTYNVTDHQTIKASRSYKTHGFRSTHCWACHHPIDSSSHHECGACGWIICFCGACGCSYENRHLST